MMRRPWAASWRRGAALTRASDAPQEERVGLLTTWLDAIVSMRVLRKHPQLWVFLGLDASVGVSEAAALQVPR